VRQFHHQTTEVSEPTGNVPRTGN